MHPSVLGRAVSIALVLVAAAPVVPGSALTIAPNLMTLDSVGTLGLQGDRVSYDASISFDGRFVAFSSQATALVPNDTNNVSDVFVRDRALRVTERVSVSSAGTESNRWSDEPSVSTDGRFVAFKSFASNLVPGDTFGSEDVFVRDRDTDGDGVFDIPGHVSTIRVSVGAAGEQADLRSFHPAVGGDGRSVAFSSYASNLVPGDGNAVADIFVHDRVSATISLASVGSSGQGNGDSVRPSLSGDGRYVAFESAASNLVAGDTNGVLDVFVRDLVGGTITRASVAAAGAQALSASNSPDISADGRYVVFHTRAPLVPEDTNATFDVYLRDLIAGTTARVSVGSDGQQGNFESAGGSISGDGRYAAFASKAGNFAGDPSDVFIVDVFLRDRVLGTTTWISVSFLWVESGGARHANGDSLFPDVSADGSFVAFQSLAFNLVPGDLNFVTDVFTSGPWVPPVTLTCSLPNYLPQCPGG